MTTPRYEQRRNLRVAFFAMLPSSNAATRAFCERPLPYLRERGIVGRVFLPSGERAYAVLLGRSGRARKLFAAIYWYGLVLPRRLVQLPRALTADVVFIQRNLLHRDAPPVLERLLIGAARLLGRRVVYHCDDALWTVGPERAYRTRFRLADAVLTGNAEIAAFARSVNDDVRCLAGGIPVGRYPCKEHTQSERVVIGWVGTNPENLASVAEVLREFASSPVSRVKVVTRRADATPALGPNVEVEYWSKEREFEVFATFDIGVMPIDDSPYSRAKEAFKLKEYMAAGLPVVCSPVGHNLEVVEDAVTGFFASSPDEWRVRLVQLVEDSELRSAMGRAARLAAQRFDVQIQANELADHLEAVAR